MSTTYFVKDGNTLCCADDSRPDTMTVLAGDILRGGHNPINGAIPMPRDKSRLRPATLADFKEFRVDPIDHMTRAANMAEFHSHVRAQERVMNAGCLTSHNAVTNVTTWTVAGRPVGFSRGIVGASISHHIPKELP